MGEVLGRERGGIVGLLRLDRDAWALIEDALMQRGFFLSDVPERVSWRALVAMARSARGSELGVAIHGEKVRWASEMHALVSMFDVLQLLVWLNSKDGAAGRNRPKPSPRPGVADPNREHFGDAEMTLDETRSWLEAKNGKR